MNTAELISAQRIFFESGTTRNIGFRIAQLKKLDQVLRANEQLMLDAIYVDLKKSRFDTFTSELSLVYREISYCLKNIRSWSKKQRVKTNLVNFPSRSYKLAEPFGVTYIAGAWNYPYQLTLIPLIDALAAGNTAIVKPSEVAPNTSAAMAFIINTAFPAEYCRVVEGGAETAKELLEHRFDYIFFTGGTSIGKKVYEAAAKHLTPVTLELGGKNPAIVLPDCDIETSAKRLVWGKFLNAGQTCVAPDYILVHASIEHQLLDAMKKILDQHFPKNGFGENYMAIVNEKHFDRIISLVDKKKIFYGGVFDKQRLFISPTIIHHSTFDDAIMKEEIFGPLLPVIQYENLDEAISKIKQFPKPLSLYLFGSSDDIKEKIFHELSFGGGSYNDTVMYFANDHLPLGGVGSSGMGSYHGAEGFKTFSHYKSIMEKATWLEFWFLKTPPYKEWKLKILRLLLEKW
ncbi:MAG: aldehyde dehydrogenase family protein [Bacteroidota bacterium]|nr:aldehyde dehydrogenase family protein [Bacteroidota bacterium]